MPAQFASPASPSLLPAQLARHTVESLYAEHGLMELLLRLREQGRTIVVSAHTERLLEAADRVIEIAGGRALPASGINGMMPAQARTAHMEAPHPNRSPHGGT